MERKRNRIRLLIIGVIAAAAMALAGCVTVPGTGTVVPEGMVWVEGGTFRMGTEGGGNFGDEEPVHSVTLSGFYMGKYEVTQAEYEEVMGSNPSYFQGETNPPAEGEEQGNRPVEQVSWYDAIVYCNMLSIKENLEPVYSIGGKTTPSEWGTIPTSIDATWNAVECNFSAKGYRLPTEAEWEYAAKGGNGSLGGYEYSGSDEIEEVAWYDEKSGNKTHEVGQKEANGLGIYDMNGNVFEWCWDWYGNYTEAAQNNPAGVSPGSHRVERGGSCSDPAWVARSAFRGSAAPSGRRNGRGFRVVCPSL